MPDGVEVTCAKCGDIFFVCMKCWRNQKYCCLDCRNTIRKRKLKSYQKKYLKTEKGRMNNRLRQRRFRLQQKTITHQYSKKSHLGLFFPSRRIKRKHQLCACCHERLNSILLLKETSSPFSFTRLKKE